VLLLYGLEQSPCAWYEKCSHCQTFGLKHSEVDYLVFYYHSSLRKRVYLIVYVNDIVIIENSHYRE